EVKVMSIGMFLEADQPVAWRGPMLHRALEQFVTEVYWGDLDMLLIDLPPGTGDIAISTAQLLPNAELLVVTTPEHTAAQVAAMALSWSTAQRKGRGSFAEVIGAVQLGDVTPVGDGRSGGGQGGSTWVSNVLEPQGALLG